MIDEKDDLAAKIRKEFGITAENKKSNYSEVNTSGANYGKDPESVAGKQTQPPKYKYEISEITRDEGEDITGQILNFSGDEEKEDEEKEDDEKEDKEYDDEEEALAALRRELSRATELSELTTIQAETDDLELQMERRGIPLIRGPKPNCFVLFGNHYL
jgi:hypothetical protein